MISANEAKTKADCYFNSGANKYLYDYLKLIETQITENVKKGSYHTCVEIQDICLKTATPFNDGEYVRAYDYMDDITVRLTDKGYKVSTYLRCSNPYGENKNVIGFKISWAK